MSDILFGYQSIAPITWAYWSAVLILSLFFKFSRFWTFRNIDLILLILLSPGLIMVVRSEGALAQIQTERARLESALDPRPSTESLDGQPARVEKPAEETAPSLPEQKMMRAARWG